MSLLAQAVDAVAKYRAEWHAERAALDKLVVECSAAKMSPVGDYWLAERRARDKYELAIKIHEALK